MKNLFLYNVVLSLFMYGHETAYFSKQTILAYA